LLGPQLVENALLPLNALDRSLPYVFGNQDLADRGYAESNFNTGLSVLDWIFQVISSRRKVSDSHSEVHKLGTIQHSILTMMEDGVGQHDGSVRDCEDRTLTQAYGGDGANGEM